MKTRLLFIFLFLFSTNIIHAGSNALYRVQLDVGSLSPRYTLRLRCTGGYEKINMSGTYGRLHCVSSNIEIFSAHYQEWGAEPVNVTVDGVDVNVGGGAVGMTLRRWGGGCESSESRVFTLTHDIDDNREPPSDEMRNISISSACELSPELF